MPIPLGVLAVAGAGAAGGSYELIQTVNGTGSSGTITFSNIDQTYKHLQIRGVTRATDGTSDIRFRLNGISTTTYAYHFLRGNGTAVSSGAASSSSDIYLQDSLTPSDRPSGEHASIIIDILDYASTTKNKTARILYGINAGANLISFSSGFQNSTSAITSLSFITAFGGAGYFTTTTRFSLYGIKG